MKKDESGGGSINVHMDLIASPRDCEWGKAVRPARAVAVID